MKRIGIWFWLFSKRYLKRISFLFLLIVLPLTGLFWNQGEQKGNSPIKIALYAQEKGLAEEIIEELEEYQGIMLFYKSNSKQELEEDILRGDAECGYVFPEGMEANIRKGRTMKQIERYVRPSTVLDKLSSEIVFSAYMKLYSVDLLEKLSETSEVFADQDRNLVKEKLVEYYDKYRKNGSTFEFAYQLLDTFEESPKMKGVSIFPIRGIMAVYIFAVGLFSAVNWFQDKERGIFSSVSYSFEFIANKIAIGVPVIWAGFSGYLALWLSGAFSNWYHEMLFLILYLLAVICFCDLLRGIFKSGIGLCSTIPVVIIGCLVFCPVFIDLRSMIPVLGTMEKFFLPYYYLNSFTKNFAQGFFLLIKVTLILTVINIGQYSIRNKKLL